MNLIAAAIWRAVVAVMMVALSFGVPDRGQAQGHSGRLPKFTDFPVAIFRGKAPPLRLGKDDLDYRTRYRALARLEPNFAGHYAISTVGCGTFCTFLLTIDLKTGRTVGLDVPAGEDLYICPDGYLDAQGQEVERGFSFRPDSRLFVVMGKMPGNECGARFFEERNGRMTMIRDVHLEKTQ